MIYEDRTIECCDCGSSFVFTASEQEFFASKGFSHDPKRCPSCRQTRKTSRSADNRYGSRAPRQMYPVTCAQCGIETEVPFEPQEGRPVYCSECYNKSKLNI